MSDEIPFLDIGQMVIHKSNQILAINKPAGLAIQSKEKPDLHQLANGYAKRKLFLVHRIDQPATGVVIFARNKSAANSISAQFRDGTVKRSYLAVVKNKPNLEKASLSNYLVVDHKSNKSYIIDDVKKHKDAKLSQLAYSYVGSSDVYHLLDVTLVSGRHHQIRAQLAHIGSPIKGDVKYGDRRSNKDRSIHLHAHRIAFQHPISQQVITIEAPLPSDTLWQFFATFVSSQT